MDLKSSRQCIPYTGCPPFVGRLILKQRMDRNGRYCHDFFWKTNFGAAEAVSYSFDLTLGGRPISVTTEPLQTFNWSKRPGQ